MQHQESVAVQRNERLGSAARINIENVSKLAEIGLVPGQRFSVDYEPNQITVLVDDNGDRVISEKVYRYRKGNVIGSRLDLKNQKVAESAEDQEMMLAIYSPGKLTICVLPIERRARDRAKQLLSRFRSGEAFRTGSLFSGVGMGDIGAESGLNKAGIASKLVFTNDIDPLSINTLVANNPAYVKGVTKTYAMDMHHLTGEELNGVDILSAGIVCKNSSKLNIAHREEPERCPDYGHLFASFLNVMAGNRWSVPVIVIENVVPYAQTIGFDIISRIFKAQGYDFYLADPESQDIEAYKGIDSHEYGALESRKRLFAIFVTKGIPMSFAGLTALKKACELTVGDIREDESRFTDKDYSIGNGLKTAFERKGRRNNLAHNEDTKVKTITAGHYRGRAEDPYPTHPEDPTRFRFFTDLEIARIKQMPEGLVDGVAAKKHQGQMLGNGIVGGVSEAVFFCIGASLKLWYQEKRKRKSFQSVQLAIAV